jgi:hypothetical protein
MPGNRVLDVPSQTVDCVDECSSVIAPGSELHITIDIVFVAS